MLQEIQVLFIEAEEAINRLVSVKVRITAELARQVAEAPRKTMGGKKQKVLSGLAQEEPKAVNYLESSTGRRSSGSLRNQHQRRMHRQQMAKTRSSKTRPSY